MQPIQANPGSEGLRAFKILMNTACASLIQVNIAVLSDWRNRPRSISAIQGNGSGSGLQTMPVPSQPAER
jgi:hypothetical protein